MLQLKPALSMASKTQKAEVTSVTPEVTETAPVVSSEETAAAVDAQPYRTVVVLAFAGTEAQMRTVWEANCSERIVVKTYGEQSLSELLEDIIADNEIGNEFVLVPANLIPVTRTSFSLLTIPYVDCYVKTLSFWGRVPVAFSKEELAAFLPANDQLNPEEFIRKYIKEVRGERALMVSHEFGNFYTKVLRSNPCENVIIEAFITKRFVYANEQGWPAVVAILEKLAKND